MSKIRPRKGLKKRKEEGRGAMTEIQSEVFALHSGRIGSETALAADGVEPIVIQREGTGNQGYRKPWEGTR